MTWLALEPLMLQRLADKLGPTVPLFGSAGFAGIADQAQIAPAVHVFFGGYAVTNAENMAGAQPLVTQNWTVVAVVRNAVSQQGGAATRADASPLCDQVLEALCGWKPDGAPYGRLKLAPAPREPDYQPGGLGYFPFTFTATISGIRGDDLQKPIAARTGA